jgi:hypothetical protein
MRTSGVALCNSSLSGIVLLCTKEKPKIYPDQNVWQPWLLTWYASMQHTSCFWFQSTITWVNFHFFICVSPSLNYCMLWNWHRKQTCHIKNTYLFWWNTCKFHSCLKNKILTTLHMTILLGSWSLHAAEKPNVCKSVISHTAVQQLFGNTHQWVSSVVRQQRSPVDDKYDSVQDSSFQLNVVFFSNYNSLCQPVHTAPLQRSEWTALLHDGWTLQTVWIPLG